MALRALAKITFNLIGLRAFVGFTFRFDSAESVRRDNLQIRRDLYTDVLALKAFAEIAYKFDGTEAFCWVYF